MEAGSSRSGGVPQVRCSASASQNVPGVRYLQRPRDQGRQVCGSGQVNSFVSTQEGSSASLLLFLRLRARGAPLLSSVKGAVSRSGATHFLLPPAAQGAFFSCLRRPHFFQQPERGGFALRRDPLLPPSAKVGKNAVQTCGLKIRSRPAQRYVQF